MRYALVRRELLVVLALAVLTWLLLTAASGSSRPSLLPLPYPVLSDYAQLTTSETPPTQAQCNSAGRRCFAPAGIHAAYNLAPLYARGDDGTGRTIAVVDSFGSDTIAHDLHVFDTTFGLTSMCGEEGVACQPGMPTFSRFSLQGTPATKAPPPTSKSLGLQDKSAWAIETSLDVESAHAIAPGANILLVTTPTAETLGVQGFPQMMNAVKYIATHHLADVISMSLGAAEGSFASTQSLLNLRDGLQAAADNGVTVLASSGDFGPVNPRKPPVGQGGSTLPGQTVGWPSTDPLVTSVGGTALCTDPNAPTRVVDNTDPPAACQDPAALGQAEIVWDEPSRGIATGGGFSDVFSRPDYQNVLPAGSTPIPADQRGVPDIALQASPRTGVLVYITLPPAGSGGLICPGGTPCGTGWYVVGGTSAASPQWAGLIAIAAQIRGGSLGEINPALYQIASDPAKYAADFYDITVGTNQTDPSVPGFPATPGWDPSTGLGTPNAANLLPDLVAASP